MITFSLILKIPGAGYAGFFYFFVTFNWPFRIILYICINLLFNKKRFFMKYYFSFIAIMLIAFLAIPQKTVAIDNDVGCSIVIDQQDIINNATIENPGILETTEPFNIYALEVHVLKWPTVSKQTIDLNTGKQFNYINNQAGVKRTPRKLLITLEKQGHDLFMKSKHPLIYKQNLS